MFPTFGMVLSLSCYSWTIQGWAFVLVCIVLRCILCFAGAEKGLPFRANYVLITNHKDSMSIIATGGRTIEIIMRIAVGIT